MTSSVSLESSEELCVQDAEQDVYTQHGDGRQGTGLRLAEGSAEQEKKKSTCQEDQCCRDYREGLLQYEQRSVWE